jgi:hypothetical protein
LPRACTIAGPGNYALGESGLSDFDFEKHVIRMLVTPPEVFPLLVCFRSIELTIVPVLLAQVNAVSTIFLAVPSMIVAAIPIVIPFLMMIVSPYSERGNQASANEKRGQCQNTTHIIKLLL